MNKKKLTQSIRQPPISIHTETHHTPATQSPTPNASRILIFSFRKTYAIIKLKTGEVDISADVLEGPILARAIKYSNEPRPMLNSPVLAINRSDDVRSLLVFFPLKSPRRVENNRDEWQTNAVNLNWRKAGKSRFEENRDQSPE